VPPIPANATNTLALWTGVTASGGAYRKPTRCTPAGVDALLITSFVGGIIGAFLLLKTRAHLFAACCPG